MTIICSCISSDMQHFYCICSLDWHMSAVLSWLLCVIYLRMPPEGQSSSLLWTHKTHFWSRERDISRTPRRTPFKFGANVHLDSEMNSFDLDGVKGRSDLTFLTCAIFSAPRGNFIKSGTNIHLDSRMNTYNYEGIILLCATVNLLTHIK